MNCIPGRSGRYTCELNHWGRPRGYLPEMRRVNTRPRCRSVRKQLLFRRRFLHSYESIFPLVFR
jgi:hypothetical protein